MTKRLTLAEVNARLDDVFAGLSALHDRLDNLRDTGVSLAQMETLRDSMIASNSQVVLDVNAIVRGLDARIHKIETATGMDTNRTLQNLARALGNMSEHINDN